MKPLDTTQESEDTRLLIRYLLNDLNEVEEEEVEERYSSDENFFTKLLATEDELIDSYVLGDISHPDREKFEEAYLSNPRRREKVESNRVLLQAVNNMLRRPPLYQRLVASLRRTLSPQNLSIGYTFAGLLLIAILSLSLVLLLRERGRLHNELAQANSQLIQKDKDYQERIAELTHGNPQPSPVSPNKQEVVTSGPQKEVAIPRRSQPVVAFSLPRVGLTRGGEAKALKPFVIKRGVLLVQLTVDVVPNDYAAYKVSLQRVGGEQVWDGTISSARPGSTTKQIVVPLPASLFRHRDYILKVTGSDSPDQILAYQHIAVVNENLVSPDNKRTRDRKTGETRREK
jgi:hypothetical protein